MKEFDVVIIGSGPGGYICAIRCAQLGLKTAIVERYSTLGGTCLNVGCIPSKAWLDSSERYHQTTQTHAKHGIDVKDVKLDFSKMRKRVEKVVSDTCSGVEFLMKKNKIEVFHGHGSFIDEHTLEVSGDKTQQIKAKNIVIATGSKPSSIPGVEIDKKRVITSTEALSLSEKPEHLLVIGGGVIGLELGSVYRRLGSKVSVVEYADSIIAGMDQDMGKQLQRSLKKEGVEFYLSHGVSEVKNDGKKVVLKAKSNKKNEELTLEGDYCLVAVGRKPYTDKLGLDKAGLQVDERGKIPVDEKFATSKSHIYAIGDVVAGAMLAHKAEEEGSCVAETIQGQKPQMNHLLIPNIVYTWPEVAGVGYTEKQLKDKQTPYKSGSFPFKALGRARASDDLDGLVKVLAHKETDEILGVHMIGPRCADMIMEAAVAMEFRASAEDIARICHGHPTFTEALKEACLAASDNRPLHI